MAQEDQSKGEEAIAALFAPYRAFVTYVPLRTEVPFLDYVELPSDAVTYEIAPRASLDPAEEAKNAIAAIGETAAAILIPGRAFDATGTRHGQGGGWYDRFLTHVPRQWKRIGFCYERQFSLELLKRESWDQEMDAVVVVGNGAVSVYEPKTV